MADYFPQQTIDWLRQGFKIKTQARADCSCTQIPHAHPISAVRDPGVLSSVLSLNSDEMPWREELPGHAYSVLLTMRPWCIHKERG